MNRTELDPNTISSQTNPNSLHEYHCSKRGPRNIPSQVTISDSTTTQSIPPKDPGHPYANTTNISFQFFDQRPTNAPFGYEYYISLPPTCNTGPPTQESTTSTKRWPLLFFLHGSGESQPTGPDSNPNSDSYACLRHGIPKIILCYDKLKSSSPNPSNISIDIPRPPAYNPKPRPGDQQHESKNTDNSSTPVTAEICTIVAENFITVTPSLKMKNGYGWTPAILSALLDDIVDRYDVDEDAVHVTGFSMGGYGTWSLAMYEPQRFATVMPICGGGDLTPTSTASIAHLPHWIHHGDKDDIIPVGASVQMYDELLKAGAKDVHFTRYPDLMHDSWTETFANVEVFKWMLSRRRSKEVV